MEEERIQRIWSNRRSEGLRQIAGTRSIEIPRFAIKSCGLQVILVGTHKSSVGLFALKNAKEGGRAHSTNLEQ